MWKLFLLILAGLYTLNPYDILPDLMVGWGWLDDLIIWILLWRYFVSLKKKIGGTGRYYQSTDGGFQQKHTGNYSGQSQSDSKDQFSENTAEREWDPYRILGITRSASIKEIKHAYRELAGKYHPDKLEHLGDEFKVLAEKRFKEIQQAYQELTGKGS
ncbi:MAG: DnaJ domain-containing protein [Desulfobacterales bacterium]|jgi:DnaJ like chaperone protein